jgi:hypothetical protein
VITYFIAQKVSNGVTMVGRVEHPEPWNVEVVFSNLVSTGVVAGYDGSFEASSSLEFGETGTILAQAIYQGSVYSEVIPYFI